MPHSFLLICVLSGAAALVYEVVWLRLLALWLGHTTGAVATVLAAFMAGLAIGAAAGGRMAPRLSSARALRRYALLELTVGACALLLPFASVLVEPVLRALYAAGGGAGFDAARVVLSLLLVTVPTIAMGATYPIAVQVFRLPPAATGDAANAAGRVYAANTIGAAIGVLLGGFVLLPILGLRGSTYVAVLLNVICATTAYLLARRPVLLTTPIHPTSPTRPLGPTHPTRPTSPTRPTGPTLPALALAVSGWVALVFEVIWTRALAMVLGPTTYAFSAMLLAFITGLAIGSTAAAAVAARVRRPGAWLGGALMTAAILAVAASLTVDRLPLVVAGAIASGGTTFGSVLWLQAGLGIAVQLPMTIALGAAFPFAVAWAAPAADDVPRAAAAIYAANTLGAIAGALAASFLLIPRLGLESSLRAAALAAIATGAAVCWWSTGARGRSRTIIAVATIAAVAAVAMLPPWNRERLAGGAYRYAAALDGGDAAASLEQGRLLYYREGAAGTVSVRELPGARALAIDGKVDASNAEDMLTQRLLAHLPLLLHERPRDVLVIGLGSGVTAGSALTHDVARVDVLEISPEVVEASALFALDHGTALSDRRARIVIGDGRSHLAYTDQRYDVIISEPSNPWMAGVATLFTREFFAAARGRLAPGGLLCQWTHTYNISDADLRSIVATFLTAFPSGSAWLVGDSDLLLVGAADGAPWHGATVEARWRHPMVAADLAAVGADDPSAILSLRVADAAGLQRYAAGARVQTDDRLALEFSAPRALYGRFLDDNVKTLLALAAGVPAPARWATRGRMRLLAGAPLLAYEDFRRGIEAGEADAAALEGLARTAAQTGRLDDAEVVLRRLGAAGSVPALVELSRVMAARGRSDEATNTARDAALRDPNSSAALRQLAVMYADRGEADALAQLSRIVERSPGHRAVALYCAVRLAALRGDLQAAATAAEELVRSAPGPDALAALATVRAALGQREAAREAFGAALAYRPRDPAILAAAVRVWE
jgi:spermidine synthase